jgi:signal transduction histidine kinase
MSSSPESPLASALAQRLRAQNRTLALRWLERISARVQLDPERIFPSEDLLDHVPLLIEGIAAYIEDAAEEVSADAPLAAKAMELGAIRHAQRFEVHEVLKEYEILGGILFHFVGEVADGTGASCDLRETLACAHRLARAVALIQDFTIHQYMTLTRAEIAEREERLRGFNRALSHEVRNRLGAVRGAVGMLSEGFVRSDATLRDQFEVIAVENLDAMERTMTNLIELSQIGAEVRQNRNVLLSQAVFESVRGLRHLRDSRDIDVHIAEDLPQLEVPASAVELALTNYLSNAIKYHDPAKSRRWIEIRGWEQAHPQTGEPEVVVAVVDNGLGVPPEARTRLFQRFYRAHTDAAANVEGTGLGLSIVRETIEGIGGRVWTDQTTEDETVFAFSLPSRRAGDHEDTAV